MTIHECKEHGAGPCLNENLIGEIAEANATLANRIAALEAQVEAAHRAIDSIGLSRCADAHAGVYPDGRITCDDGRPPLSLVDRVEWLIRWLSDDPYPMGPRIKALEAENAALKAERDAYRSQFWDKSIPDLVEMRKQRDDARAAFNVMDGCYKQAMAERDNYWARLGMMTDAYAAANVERDEAVQKRLEYLDRLSMARDKILEQEESHAQEEQYLSDALDAARAWAAAFHAAAKIRRNNA